MIKSDAIGENYNRSKNLIFPRISIIWSTSDKTMAKERSRKVEVQVKISTVHFVFFHRLWTKRRWGIYWGSYWEFDCNFYFVRAVVNIPIQTLTFLPWLLFRKMIISQLGAWPACVQCSFCPLINYWYKGLVAVCGTYHSCSKPALLVYVEILTFFSVCFSAASMHYCRSRGIRRRNRTEMVHLRKRHQVFSDDYW